MITRFFSRSPLHEDADPAQRVLGVAELDAQAHADALRQLLRDDPAPEVRSAAATRCTDREALVTALETEMQPGVRDAIVAALAREIAAADDAVTADLLYRVDDRVRGAVACGAADPARRRLALDAIVGEDVLLDVALNAGQSETRALAADKVVSTPALERLADVSRTRDHGVYRSVRQRLDAIRSRAEQDAEADRVVELLEALATRPGPILSEVVELNRRWQALDMSADALRLERCEAARRCVQERLEREQEEQRARTRAEGQLKAWCETLQALQDLPDASTLERLEYELAGMRQAAEARGDARGQERLDEAGERLGAWMRASAALAGAEMLVLEAERLAMGTYIDHGDLPARWEALDRTIRTPALTRRFEAALIAVDQRRLAHVQAAQQEATVLRQQIHSVLHASEQALAGGHLKEARAGVDDIRKLRGAAGTLPKPTVQRISRLQQQLVEMERWESFGQRTARVQLCERAEALAAFKGELRQLALDVQALRNEWKALDQQQAGVPKSLWERFDRACEKAYAPAARHFAEQSARRKEARKKRDDFIALAAEHALMLSQQEPKDWRAAERWLRETDQQWREGDLGSTEPRVWKELDAQMKTAVAPLRTALGQAREDAKQVRRQLIDRVQALAAKASDRDTPSQVKAIQGEWQQHAKSMSLAQRDERALWEEFRTACDAVFHSRTERRKQDDGVRSEARQALEALCAEMEALARASDKSDQEVRRSIRALQDLWREKAGGDPAHRGLENRLRAARMAVESTLASRERSRESAVWQTLAAKERLCDELDRWLIEGAGANVEDAVLRWQALPELAKAMEQRMAARRDAAVHALGDETARAALCARIQSCAKARQDALLELEVLLGLDSPAEYQADRLAFQVKQLRDRFKAATAVGPEQSGERLLAWSETHGTVQGGDRGRIDRIFGAVGRRR